MLYEEWAVYAVDCSPPKTVGGCVKIEMSHEEWSVLAVGTQHAASLQRTLAYFDTTSPEECPERIPQTHKNVALLLCHTAGGRSVL